MARLFDIISPSASDVIKRYYRIAKVSKRRAATYLYNLGVIDKQGEELILNTMAIAISNPEFTERNFVMLVKKFKKLFWLFASYTM